ncbi:MAG: hypothetical protein IPJ30_01525 [Acidobacteria bacterium]|nr:hypothetical protein [Acidobacteriota bacterium]
MKTIFGQTVLISAFAVLFAFVAGANAARSLRPKINLHSESRGFSGSVWM